MSQQMAHVRYYLRNSTVAPTMDDSSLDAVISLIKQMESTLLGLEQLRNYVGDGVGRQMLEVLIEEAETKLAEIKRKIIQ